MSKYSGVCLEGLRKTATDLRLVGVTVGILIEHLPDRSVSACSNFLGADFTHFVMT
jgi:hypothetical protein